MKTIVNIIASLSVILGLAACQQYKIDTQMTPEKAAASIKLVCDALDSYTRPASSPENITFNVSANTPWTITRSAGADWCTVSPSSSASSTLISDVVVTLANNTSDSDRKATLTIKGENVSRAITVTILQTRLGKLYVTPVAKDYSAVGGPLNFTINTNMDWEVHSSATWLKIEPEKGAPDPDGRTLTIVATAEASNVMERMATVTVIAGDDEESFDVYQRARFDLTALSEVFEPAGGSKTFSFKTDLDWEVSSSATWLTFDKEEGTGSNQTTFITAIAAANEDASRKATVTVTAGDVQKTFDVSQRGFTFEIVAPESTELNRLGQELTLEVNTSGKAWNPATEVPGWTVTKVDDTHFKVTAPFNDIFKAKTGNVSIIGDGEARADIELTQDMNFTFKGNTELLEDGSVKIYEDVVSGVVTKDDFRYVIMDVDVEMHLGNKGSFTMCTEHYDSGYEYELQMNLNRSDAFRLRSNGSKVPVHTAVGFTFDLDKANAMTHGQIQFIPDPDDATMINQSFYCNGEKVDNVLVSTSAFAAEPELAGTYFVGSIVAADDGSYFILKSCTVTPVE